MKELLISISNELLDNVDDLRSSLQLKKLSQDRSDVLLRQLENLHACQSLSRIVVDEAHFVSQWGHDFRPDYQSLGILKQKFPDTPVLALTATTTASVKEDVVQALGLVFCIVFTQSFNRPNLWYSTVPRQITVWRTSTNSLETTILMNVAIYIVFPEWTVRKFWRSCRFSAPMKTAKPLVAKDPLAASSGKTNNPQENEADKSLSAKIFDALMLLRSGILDTAAEGVNVHHIHLCST